jgi:tripartite-type tricarboxylate transporter receptor subunit TctC
MKMKSVFRHLACIVVLSGSVVALAQDYPVRPIKLVVPFPPGGGTDKVARAIGTKLSARLGQPIVVDNKPGGGTIIGAEAVSKAPADGYTLLLTGSSTYSVLPALKHGLPYDPIQSFSLLAIVAKAPLVLVANPETGVKNLSELIELVRAKPGTYTYATFGAGSGPHVAGELLSQETGMRLLPIPYKGSSQAITALLSNEINIMIDSVASAAPHIQAGKLRVLAVLGEQRSSMLPDVPTVAELNYPRATFDAWYGIAAPAGTPQAVLQKLTTEVDAIMKSPETKSGLKASAMEATMIRPDEFRAKIESEIAIYQAIGKRAKIAID